MLHVRLRLDGRARTGLLVGGVAMFFALDIAFLASLAGFAFAPDAFGQALIEVMPGFIVVPLIGLLQFWAKRLLVAGVLIGFLGCGAIAGALAVDPRRRDRTVLAVGALPWVASVVLGQLFAPGAVDVSSVLITSAVGAVAYFVALQLLTGVATTNRHGRRPSARRRGGASSTARPRSRRSSGSRASRAARRSGLWAREPKGSRSSRADSAPGSRRRPRSRRSSRSSRSPGGSPTTRTTTPSTRRSSSPRWT